ncbi:hypothetical protein [Pseudomonas cremoricolorata]|uniref:hypothetical protein n=1 Tax=Pseudomonas cremoricolorata TaxID=157783 RepID=UPI0003FDE7CD|nr:hypothetical protein [Pseudomonas cremoricolorata]
MTESPSAQTCVRPSQATGAETRASCALSILAGNSRVFRDAQGVISVQPQLHAFDAALRLACAHLARYQESPRLSVAFDHCGIFRLQFLDEGLSNAQKRRPRLSQLHPVIRDIFQPIADHHGIALSDIWAIHEDSARQHLSHTLASRDLPEALLRKVLVAADHDTAKLSCAAITKEYFERALGGPAAGDAQLEVFFEEDAWSARLAYVRGLQLSHLLGVNATIRLNLVSACGEVHCGEAIAPRG